MPLFGPRPPIQPQKPRPESFKEKTPPAKPKDTSIFGGKPYLKGEEVRNWGGSDTAFGATNLPREERIKRIKNIFGGTDFITKGKTEKALGILEKQRYYAKTDKERAEIDKDIKITKGILGKK